MTGPETLLEIAQRHVREGEQRVARQTALVAKLDGNNSLALAAQGRRVLETMRAALAMSRRHLRDIEARSKR